MTIRKYNIIISLYFINWYIPDIKQLPVIAITLKKKKFELDYIQSDTNEYKQVYIYNIKQKYTELQFLDFNNIGINCTR